MAPGEPVPRDLLARTMEDVDARLRADGARRLGAVGLVEEGEESLRLHQLVAHFVRREELDTEAETAVDRVLIQSGRAALDGVLTGAALAATIRHLVHAAAIAAAAVVADENAEQGRLASEALRSARIMQAAGLALSAAADHRGAQLRFQQCLDIHERVLGPDHPDTAMSLYDLAWVLRKQSKLVAARPLFERNHSGRSSRRMVM